MNKPTFTKGPWTVKPRRDDYSIEGDGERIASVDNWENANPRANARLIASAPELFKALKAIYEIDVPDAEWSPTLEKCFGVALDAIAKVEGEK